MDKDILQLIYKRDYLHNIYLKSKSDQHYLQYQSLRNQVTAVIRNKKREFYHNKILGSKNSKELWTTLRHILPSWNATNSIPSDLSASDFNNHFTIIGETLSNSVESLAASAAHDRTCSA